MSGIDGELSRMQQATKVDAKAVSSESAQQLANERCAGVPSPAADETADGRKTSSRPAHARTRSGDAPLAPRCGTPRARPPSPPPPL